MSGDPRRPAARYPAAEWIRAPDLADLFRALGAPDVDVRLVGGSVRNTVMNLPVDEIDIATPEPPDAVAARLSRAGVKTIPTGLAHGTLTAVMGARTFEITSLRRDTACDGRHAAVEFTDDWAEDARRRDFTFNAMSLRPDGALFDYHGGLADAAAGRVRFVGAPADRIREDYLRILRLFRFLARYGRQPPDAPTLEACRAHAGGLLHLSAERVQQELAKTLAAPDPAPVLALMRECGVLEAVLPEAGDLAPLAALPAVEGAAGAPADWRRRLAACLQGDTGAQAAARLKVSNTDRAHLARLTAPTPAVDAATPLPAVRAALYAEGPEIVRDRLLLAWAQARAGSSGARDDAPWRARLDEVGAWRPKHLPVSGADALALGVPPGPAVGALLAAVEAWWIAADFAPGRSDVLAELKRLAAARKR